MRTRTITLREITDPAETEKAEQVYIEKSCHMTTSTCRSSTGRSRRPLVFANRTASGSRTGTLVALELE